MIKFALLTLVSFGIGLAAIPETWLTRESDNQEECVIQPEPDATFKTTVVNDEVVVTIPVVGESRDQNLSKDIPTRTRNEQANVPDLSDINVL